MSFFDFQGHNKCGKCGDLPEWKRHLPVVSNVTVPANATVYGYCEHCSAACPHDARLARLMHPNHNTDAGPVWRMDTVRLYGECCSVEEEQALVRMLNKRTWMTGQSGCLRQDYGPVVDYAQQKVCIFERGEFSSGLSLDLLVKIFFLRLIHWHYTSSEVSLQKVNQSINWSKPFCFIKIVINQSINQSMRTMSSPNVNRSINQSIDRAFSCPSVNQSINQGVSSWFSGLA